jgi:hypothetical protein
MLSCVGALSFSSGEPCILLTGLVRMTILLCFCAIFYS